MMSNPTAFVIVLVIIAAVAMAVWFQYGWSMAATVAAAALLGSAASDYYRAPLPKDSQS